jgi:hypothetical protein
VRACEKCKSKDVYRTSRRTIVQFAASLAGFYPYVCRHCKSKTYHFRSKQLFVSFAALLVTLLLFSGPIYLTSRSPIAKPARSRVLSFRVADGKISDPAKPQPSESTALISLPNILTNGDVSEYAKSGMAPASLSWLIRSMPHRFELDSKSLARLKQGGLPDEVIRTMTEVTLGTHYR